MTKPIQRDEAQKYYFGYHAKSRRIYAVMFKTTSAEQFKSKMEMFKESNLEPIELENHVRNRLALKKMLAKMNQEGA